jgi:hypothetical protein
VGQWLKGKGGAEPDGEKWDWFDEQLWRQKAEGKRGSIAERAAKKELRQRQQRIAAKKGRTWGTFNADERAAMMRQEEEGLPKRLESIQ